VGTYRPSKVAQDLSPLIEIDMEQFVLETHFLAAFQWQAKYLSRCSFSGPTYRKRATEIHPVTSIPRGIADGLDVWVRAKTMSLRVWNAGTVLDAMSRGIRELTATR
jgi:hypothetical protein